MAINPPPVAPAPINIPVVVGEVVKSLQQMQGQQLPPSANTPPAVLATAEILGQDPGARRPLGAVGAAVQLVWNQTVQGLPAGRRYAVAVGNPQAFPGQTTLSVNGQSSAAGTALPVEPAVRVTDILGRPVQGVNVEFVVTEGGGAVAAAQAATNANGIASSGAWTLGAAPGLNTLAAKVGGDAVVKFWAIAV